MNRLLIAAVVVAICSAACTKAAPSMADGAAVLDDAPPLPVVTNDATTLLFSFVDAAGRMQAVPRVDAVPEGVRQRVLVVDLSKTPEQRQAHRYAYFADLTSKNAAGTYPVVVVSRYDAATRQAGVPTLSPSDGTVVVYSAVWCGYCKKAKAWLRDHGVPFVERDVEKTPGAQAELSAKLKAAGVPGGGVPVIDWGGTIIVGFDVAAFERLLKDQPAVAPVAPAVPGAAETPPTPPTPPASAAPAPATPVASPEEDE